MGLFPWDFGGHLVDSSLVYICSSRAMGRIAFEKAKYGVYIRIELGWGDAWDPGFCRLDFERHLDFVDTVSGIGRRTHALCGALGIGAVDSTLGISGVDIERDVGSKHPDLGRNRRWLDCAC